jgi:Fe-S-cluster-containing dehydrogenase component/DMSO reductase anchor subunit
LVRLPIIDNYLEQQRDLTAVERFSRAHDKMPHAGATPRYRELMPATAPTPGQQYAFHVDLDRCTGCKACVTACHSLNGLDGGEIWRNVGLLHGGSAEQPVQQTVTAACHHCIDPACLKGCPVNAYEKDPVTGIVKHLDDQCIGCKYCTLTCPYEVPQYDAKRGIVRKCDMCSDRLAHGEAPACVQACPNEAISIELVETRQVLENAQVDAFLPAAPSPGITVPTTTYATERSFPRNLLPADFYAVRPSEQHRPLVVMLVLTQLSVGAFCVDRACTLLGAGAAFGVSRFVHAAAALAIGLLALGASMLHLGRPLYAFRAVLGLRRSWLSREILGFGVFAKLAFADAALLWYTGVHAGSDATGMLARISTWLGHGVALSGLLAVFCSSMLYHATLRRFWSFSRSAFKFFMTSAVLGLAATIALAVISWALFSAATASGTLAALCYALACAQGLKLAGELSGLLHLREHQHTELKRSAMLMRGELWPVLRARLWAGVLGGIVAPLVLAYSLQNGVSQSDVLLALVLLALATAGELLERLLFFSAVSAPKMPGALR